MEVARAPIIPEVKRPPIREVIKAKVNQWTETGRVWLRELKTMVEKHPREVIHEISEAPLHKDELVTAETGNQGIQNNRDEVNQAALEINRGLGKEERAELSNPAIVTQRMLEQPDPLPLSTKSGVDEPIFISAKHEGEVRGKDILEQTYGATIVEPLSVALYVQGNGLLHNTGGLSVIGYRDMLIMEDQNGRFAYTDYKGNDYRLKEGGKVELNEQSLREMSDGSNAIQRDTYSADRIQFLTEIIEQRGDKIRADQIRAAFQENGDPYAKGLGQLMQAVSIEYLLDHGITRIKRNIRYSEGGNRMWQEFGVAEVDGNGNGIINPDVVRPKIQSILKSHGLV